MVGIENSKNQQTNKPKTKNSPFPLHHSPVSISIMASAGCGQRPLIHFNCSHRRGLSSVLEGNVSCVWQVDLVVKKRSLLL